MNAEGINTRFMRAADYSLFLQDDWKLSQRLTLNYFAIPVDAKESMMKAVALCYISLDKKDQLGAVLFTTNTQGKRLAGLALQQVLRWND